MNLPAGLIDNNIEFFVAEDMVSFYKLKGGASVPYEEFEPTVLASAKAQLNAQPLKIAELHLMGITDSGKMLKQYLICNYGGFDNAADMIDGVLQPTEYWPCPMRGNCPHEGKLCDSLRTDTGEVLTKREIEVLKQVALGKLDKEIADALSISPKTVPTHTKNIRLKTGEFRKAGLTRFAINKNLI